MANGDDWEDLKRKIIVLGITQRNHIPLGQQVYAYARDLYIAGLATKARPDPVASGLELVNDYFKAGKYSTVDILGESALNLEEADKHLNFYLKLIDRIAERKLQEAASISVKPTAICPIDSCEFQDDLASRLEVIVDHAQENHIKVTLDMEDHNWTDATLQAAQHLWGKGYDNVGIVLQAKLDRTKGDLRDIIKNAEYAIPKSRIRVRACIGIYDEDEGRATRDKAVAKASLFERIKELFDTGAYVEFATHDQPLLRKILNEIIPPVDKSRFEFQFLKGVRSVEGVATDLIAKGFKVRYYMPIEMQPGDGDRYILRRLSESPDMAENFLKDSLKYGLQRIAKAARS